MGIIDQSQPQGAKTFRKSTISENGGHCVEVAFVEGGVVVRDSKNPDGPELHFTREEWKAFVEGVQAKEPQLTGESAQS